MSRHDMFSPGRNDDPPTWRWCTYTRADLVRAILGQQWAVAIACVMCARPKPAYLAAVLAHLPSPDDVVTAMEQT